VRLPEFVRTTTFRWTVGLASTLAICILLMFGFVYWQTSTYVVAEVDQLIADRADEWSKLPQPQLLEALKEHLEDDPRRVKLGGLFSAGGNRIIGNIEHLPPDLQPDTAAHDAHVLRIDALGLEQQIVRATARRLTDGGTLVVGRSLDEVAQIGRVVERALIWGLIPGLCLCVVAGAFLSIRARRRIEQVNRKVQRIIAGELHERLPTQGVDDPFDQLATLVNRMLDKIEALVRSVAGVGDDIAHDLRTPLTRVRVVLERGRQNASDVDQLRAAVDQAMTGLDQSLAMITALLRIAEIEHSRRMAAFGDVALADLVREVGELYAPIAEDKGVALTVDANEEIAAPGDRDLLFEAIANLVDNAVKFTQQGGRVEVKLCRVGNEGVVQVSDTGRGIAAADHELVRRRFYRSDKSRTEPGLGLGLSLVSAIVKLHGFRFTISPGPGCVAQIAFERPFSPAT
jgi:signal transduction histidine kinase